MNFGVLRGFTYKSANIPAGEAFPRMQIKFIHDTWRELRAEDVNCVLVCTNASAVTLSLPRLGLANGEAIHVKQKGAGQVTIAAGGGVSIEVAAGGAMKTREQYSVISLMKESDVYDPTQTWMLFGDFDAA